MTDYGKGGVLGAANMLPATAAFYRFDNTHPIIVAALFLVSALSLVILLASLSRFLINIKRGQ